MSFSLIACWCDGHLGERVEGAIKLHQLSSDLCIEMPAASPWDICAACVSAGSLEEFPRLWHLHVLGEVMQADPVTLERYLIVAVLIAVIASDFDLALLYLMGRRPVQSSQHGFCIEDCLSQAWDCLLEDQTFALHCVVELLLPAGPLYMIAERFVMESILVRRVVNAASRGVTMALDEVVDVFLGLWLARTSASGHEHWLTRLAHHENSRRKFGVHLRSVWNLHCGTLRTVTPVDEATARQKASRM